LKLTYCPERFEICLYVSIAFYIIIAINREKKMKKIILVFSLIAMAMGAELSIGITGNNRGLLTPCGCAIPSGGWARISTVVHEIQRPDLMLGAGNHFFHHMPSPKDDQIREQKIAAFQAEMFFELSYDVINAGQFDLCYGLRFLRELRDKFELPIISANILDMNGELAFPAYKVYDLNGLNIMFIGITHTPDGFNYLIKDPLKALSDLHSDSTFVHADLVILLADAPAKLLSDHVKEYDGIDIIIGSKEPAFTNLPIHYKQSALVQMGSQGKYFGTLNLHWKENISDWFDLSPYLYAVEAIKTDLKDPVIGEKSLKRKLKNQKKKLRKKQKQYSDNFSWHMLRLDNEIKDDPKIKERVEEFTPYP